MNSSVLKWPDKESVIRAVHDWAGNIGTNDYNILKIGYFGSYARDDWGVGSDIDHIVIIDSSTEPFESRALKWDTTVLPVPAECVVYTQNELKKFSGYSRFY